MTTEREATCEERLSAHLKGRLDDIRMILAGTDPDTGEPFDGDYPEDEQHERLDPLGVEVTITVRVQLSTGGPGDQFEMDYTPGEWQADAIRYRFLDWFDGHAVTLHGGEAALVEMAYGELASLAASETGSARV